MSNPEQDQDQYGRRKSKRQRVPNAYYTAGINELKKITLKNQSKKNRNDDDDDYSSQEERNMSQNNRNYTENYYTNQRTQGSASWLTCIMPKSNKQIKVQVVLDSSTLSQKQQIRAREEPVIKPSYLPQSQNSMMPSSKKVESQGGLNLLSLFQKVIKNVSDEVPSPVKNTNVNSSLQSNAMTQEPVIKHSGSITQKQQKQPVLPPAPKRVIQQDKDGKIISLQVDRQKKVMVIKHSKIGQCSVPIEVDPPCWKIQEEKTEQEIEAINELKKKLASNAALLKSIPIFN